MKHFFENFGQLQIKGQVHSLQLHISQRYAEKGKKVNFTEKISQKYISKMTKGFTILFVAMIVMMTLIKVECFSAGVAGNMHSAGKKRDMV